MSEQLQTCEYPRIIRDTRDNSFLSELHSDLCQGKLLVLPTDTVYGIACAPFLPGAIRSLLAAKHRDKDFPPPVLVSDLADMKELIDPKNLLCLRQSQILAKAFWPGALTIIVCARPDLNWDLGRTNGTIALRMPKNDLALRILQKTGPLAVSSANIHTAPPATSMEQAQEYFSSTVHWYVDGGNAVSGISSTIVNIAHGQVKILREGQITGKEIAEVLS